jgi:RNA polymerase sporulation-specific sigma factor
VGTPAEVKKELDNLAMRLQRRPKDQDAFLRIVCYMHKYILGLVFKKYSFVRGSDEKDVYQEALIALFKKAIPSFRKHRGMSFLNFAKMCINRHLITILNASRNRRRDWPLNTSISLDHSPGGGDEDDDACPLSNVVPDTAHGKPPFNDMAKSETFEKTLGAIKSVLSDFEQSVLMEYLQDKSYKDASKAISKKYGRRCNERSIDNALLRIRKKAMALKVECGEDALPLVFSPMDGGK